LYSPKRQFFLVFNDFHALKRVRSLVIEGFGKLAIRNGSMASVWDPLVGKTLHRRAFLALRSQKSLGREDFFIARKLKIAVFEQFRGLGFGKRSSSSSFGTWAREDARRRAISGTWAREVLAFESFQNTGAEKTLVYEPFWDWGVWKTLAVEHFGAFDFAAPSLSSVIGACACLKDSRKGVVLASGTPFRAGKERTKTYEASSPGADYKGTLTYCEERNHLIHLPE
jgi:hypothetical protein